MVSSGLKYYFVFHQIIETSSYIRIIKRVYQLMNQLKNKERWSESLKIKKVY